MTWQQSIHDNPKQGKLYHFMEYKKKKPFFQKPIKIMIEDSIKEPYYLLKNVVYKEKQILVLKREKEPDTIILVEAIIKDGQLHYISKLSDKMLRDITSMIESTIS
ncbi:hypothetical protein FAY30_10990 [Bacillus sp. S3]|uniref:hypothetical protein n=1 Tax=Bacillus sp. S3 TaxID=486398 RepID=UPI001189BD49|nr:hypothetical protein [Bacillus sp. S3]QCJ42391.1 hypothetical protein FAY30_10990 [Bacillus sp. S3]